MNFCFFQNDKRTFRYLAIICALFLGGFFAVMLVYNNSFYTCMTDDVLQYFKMTEDFVIKLKTGNLSFYAYNSYLGASFFGDTYYVPLDFFTYFTFFLTFFLNFEVAFGFTELLKLFLGTMMFAYFLRLRGFSNKAIFFTSLVYMFCGYNTTMMAFSAFFSLAFYYPFAAVCLEKFRRGNYYILPLCAAMLLFYNFYLGACVMAFMAVLFVLTYFFDHKFKEVKDEIKEKKPDLTDYQLFYQSLFTYLGRFIKRGLLAFGLMVLGIMMALIIMMPSLFYVLKDTFPRGDTLYKWWSFDSGNGDGYTNMNSMAQFVRIISEIFTPTYSTNYYAFNNSYITDHMSLYITVTGFISALYVFQLKDRESWHYKFWILLEIILLSFPLFYMVFSLNKAPYTRWFGMLNLFNLMIFAHIITKTDFKLKMAGLWAIIRNFLLIILLIYVFNYFTTRIYDYSFINYFSRLFAGKDLTPLSDQNLYGYKIDMIFLVVAISLIIIITLVSIQKKFNILPYALAVELVVALSFMFGNKLYFYDTIDGAAAKDELNAYLDSGYIDIPYDGQYSRIHLDTRASENWAWSRNYTRTNSYLSDLRIFHSFYDDGANEFIKLAYDDASMSRETRDSKVLANEYSLFVHQLLATKYVVVETSYENYLPTEYYREIEGSRTDKYVTYEVINYQPFMIYDEAINDRVYYINKKHLIKQEYLLNYGLIDEKYFDYVLSGTEYENVKKSNYTMNSQTVKYDVYDKDRNMIGYYLSGMDFIDTEFLASIPTKGLMHFYYNVGNGGARMVEFDNVELEYADGRRENAFGGYAFYDEIPKMIWIENNEDLIALNKYSSTEGTSHILSIEYCDFQAYEQYLLRMENYHDLQLKMSKSTLHLSYSRDDATKSNVLALPFTYNNDWVIDKDYEIISVNGGFLGVVIPKGIEEINFTLKFTPKKIEASAIISILGIILMGGLIYVNERRMKKNETDFVNRTLL